MSAKKTVPKNAPYFFLVAIAEDESGCIVSLVTESKVQKRATPTDRLVQILLQFPRTTGLLGIVLSGTATRFSESRAIATMLNTLAYVWHVPIVEGVLAEPLFSSGVALLQKADGPVLPRYSAPPNITQTKKTSHIRPTHEV